MLAPKALAHARNGHGAMLKSAFGKHWHVESGDSFEAARNDLAFERIKLLNGHGGKGREGNAFGNFDHAGFGKWAEAVKSVMSGRRVGANVTAAQSTAVGQRVFDAANAPAFLVKHQIVYDAPNGQLPVFLDGIIFEVFVATVAVNEVFPIWVTSPYAAAKRRAPWLHIPRRAAL